MTVTARQPTPPTPASAAEIIAREVRAERSSRLTQLTQPDTPQAKTISKLSQTHNGPSDLRNALRTSRELMARLAEQVGVGIPATSHGQQAGADQKQVSAHDAGIALAALAYVKAIREVVSSLAKDDIDIGNDGGARDQRFTSPEQLLEHIDELAKANMKFAEMNIRGVEPDLEVIEQARTEFRSKVEKPLSAVARKLFDTDNTVSGMPVDAQLVALGGSVDVKLLEGDEADLITTFTNGRALFAQTSACSAFEAMADVEVDAWKAVRTRHAEAFGVVCSQGTNMALLDLDGVDPLYAAQLLDEATQGLLHATSRAAETPRSGLVAGARDALDRVFGRAPSGE